MNYLTTTEFESRLVPGLKYKLRKISHARRIDYNSKGAKLFERLNEIERELEPLREEMRKATEAARIEPCSCEHEVNADNETVKRALASYNALAEGAKQAGNPFSELFEVCHLETSGKCIVPGCGCRKPAPADEVEKRLPELAQKHWALIHEELYPFRIRFAVTGIDGLEIDGSPATIDSFLAEMPDEVVGEIGKELERVFGFTLEEQLGFKSPTTSGAVETGQSESTPAPSASANVST